MWDAFVVRLCIANHWRKILMKLRPRQILYRHDNCEATWEEFCYKMHNLIQALLDM